MWLFVATDGSTYQPKLAPDGTPSPTLAGATTYDGLPLTRAAQGQALPITGMWPLQQRRPVGINLCRCERNALLWPGELGVDPELGDFAFAPNDPAVPYALGQPDPAVPTTPGPPNTLVPQEGLSVDYVEAFGDRVGARTFDRL